MRPRCTSSPVTSIPPRPRSPCWCARRRPACPVRCVPSQRGVSTAGTHAPWPICRGRTTACASSSASASGSAAIALCRRRIFTERLPTVTAPWARRTLRLAQRLVALGVALGGKAGVRLGQRWGLRGEPEHPAAAAPPAARPVVPHAHRARGGRFRPAETAHLWHDPGGPGTPPARGAPPGSHRRDRGAVAPGAPRGGGDHAGSVASAYAEGARQGAPAATQVADRFHLFQNLAEALTQVFTTHGRALDAVNAHGAPAARAPARWDARGPRAPAAHAPGRAGPRGPARRPPAGAL